MTEPNNTAPAAITALHVKSAKPEKPIRLASGRIAKIQKGQAPTAAHFNALLEDNEALSKRLAQLEKAIAPKPTKAAK